MIYDKMQYEAVLAEANVQLQVQLNAANARLDSVQDELGASAEALAKSNAELAHLKANNRYQRGYDAGERSMMVFIEKANARVKELEAIVHACVTTISNSDERVKELERLQATIHMQLEVRCQELESLLREALALGKEDYVLIAHSDWAKKVLQQFPHLGEKGQP